jgi:dimethylargininase
VRVKQMLVRAPSRTMGDSAVTPVARVPVDVKRARRQWDSYVETVTHAGWQTTLVAEASSCPDGVFIEDLVVVFDDVAVITRPCAISRRPEVRGLEESLELLGYAIHRIDAPGTLEGGDVLAVGDTVYVGQGGRSNAEGIDQLRTILEPHGATVVAIPMGRVLHLTSALTALPDGSIIGYVPALVNPGIFPRFHAVPELQGSNVVLLGGDTVLIAADCRRSARLIAGLGFEVVSVDIGEFQKRGASVSCLSVRLPEPPAVTTTTTNSTTSNQVDALPV